MGFIKDKYKAWRRSREPVRCFGTYHKTGTVWIRRVCKQFAAEQGLYGFLDFSSDPLPKESLDNQILYFHDHSRFPEPFHNRRIRGVRVIRDPRDVVISGALYHRRSDEDWLHQPQERFNGKSYSQAIGELDDVEAQYRFEMCNVAADTISDMVSSLGDKKRHKLIRKRFLTVKYEDLIEDRELIHFARICDHLKLPFDRFSPYFVSNSMFSTEEQKDQHIRSGKREQWREAFTPEFAREFATLHQDSLVALGYEKDDGWVDQVRKKAS